MLPAGGKAARLDRKEAELRKLYAQREARLERARQELVRVEEEARALDLDPDSDLFVLKIDLDRRRQHLDLLAQAPSDLAFEEYRKIGIEDPEEAVARLRADMDEREKLAKLLEVIAKVRELRHIAGIQEPRFRSLP